MDNPVTYICIKMHSACFPTDPKNHDYTPQMMRETDPRVFSMMKYTVAFPGFVGMENTRECDYAKNAIDGNPGINCAAM